MSPKSNGFGQTEIAGLVMKTTDDALLYQIDHGREVWIPRKVVLGGPTIEDADTDLVIADWWLKQERLL